jgi:hypothetical protein
LHRKKRIIAIAAAFSALSLTGASSALAATEVGNACVGDRAETPNSTIVQLASTTNPGAVSVPVAGVITKWKVNVVPYPGGISEKLKVLRPAGGNSFTTVGESTTQPILGGQNSFDTRIPVQAGDRLGAYSAFSPIFCAEASAPTDVLGVVPGDTSLGSTTAFTELPEGQPAISATVEPDADNDGFGDETQDKCPQNAAVQVPCPVVALSTSASARKGLANILVTSSFQASVTVAGTVNLGKGKSVKLSGGTQIVAPGAIAKFTLLFPQKLKAKLKQLSRKRFLWLNIGSTAPNIVGPATVSGLKVKLRGQAKPKPKAKAKPKQRGKAKS